MSCASPVGSRLKAHFPEQVFPFQGVENVALNHQNGLYITLDLHRYFAPLTGEGKDRFSLKTI